jgi:hypothetical protein
MSTDSHVKPFGASSPHPDQPPPSGQPNASARPTEPPPESEAPTDSATAAQRTMKQTSKTVPEDGTARQ